MEFLVCHETLLWNHFLGQQGNEGPGRQVANVAEMLASFSLISVFASEISSPPLWSYRL